MNEACHRSLFKSFGAFRYILGMVLIPVLVVSWFVWGPLGIILYVDGLFNSSWLFALAPFLLLPIPVIVVCVPILIAYTVFRWSRFSNREKRRHGLVIAVVLAFVVSLGLEIAGMIGPGDMFARGLARYVDRRTSIAAIQDWLSTLDPNDCEDQPLEVKIAPDAKISRPPKYVPAPPAVARLGHYSNTLSRDDAGRPMIRFHLGGGGLMMHWGIVIGQKDMVVPPSDSSDFGEARFLLAPGAYVWLSE